MKKKIILILIGALLMTFLLVGTVNAQDDSGYPVATSTETENSDPVCDGERLHPVLDGFSTKFNILYDDLLVYFCDLDLGVGEIALALQTSQRTDGEVALEDLFTQRVDDGLGWGEIWQDLNLIGGGMMRLGRGTKR